MLHTSTETTTAPGVLPWAHLDIPHRMARVIEARRHLISETVSERDFQEAPETCDLSLDELRANIGRASIIVHQAAPEPAYDREARIRLGVQLVMGMMPAIATIHTTLRQAEFTNGELATLWDEIIARSADDFHADRAPRLAVPGLWAPEILAENAN